MIPVATPIAKLTAKSFIQNFVVRFQNSSPVITYRVSIKAIRKPRPRVRGTNSQWYMAVRANCHLDRSTSVVKSICLRF